MHVWIIVGEQYRDNASILAVFNSEAKAIEWHTTHIMKTMYGFAVRGCEENHDTFEIVEIYEWDVK